MRGGTLVERAELVDEPSELGGTWRSRHWLLHLACGHQVVRPVTYKANPHRVRRSRGYGRDLADVLPAQRRAYCPDCPPPPRPAGEAVKIRVRAAPITAAAVIGALEKAYPGLTVQGPRYRAGGFVDYYCEVLVTDPMEDTR